jgi:acyl phosphate:glycerol-3-phosphate acyltransferase
MSPWTALVVGMIGSFLLGSLPTSYLVGKRLKGIDLREHGSGNLGATNVYRVLGVWAAVPVLLVDLGKGALAVSLGLWLLPSWSVLPDLTALGCAVGAILGHSLSPFVGFKGGKGVATAAGAFVTLAPAATLAAMGVWVLLLATTRIMSVASVAAAAVLPVNLLTLELLREDGTRRWATLVVGLCAATWVIVRHRANLRRLREGKEDALW